jgi:hypothetical protein
MLIEHRKNVAFELCFPMVDSTTPAQFKTGETVADAAYYKDGAGAWTSLAIADTAAEVGTTGVYEISLTAGELNHDWVFIKFTSTNAADTLITFRMDGNIPVNVEAIEAGAITAAAIATDAVDADAVAADAATEIRNAVTGGAYALDTDANGRVRIVDGTGTGELDTANGKVSVTDGAIAAATFAAGALDANALATDAVNEIRDAVLANSMTEPSQGAPPQNPTLEQLLMYLYLYFYKKADVTSALQEVHNHAETVICKATLSDNGTTFTRAAHVSGP